MHFKLILSWKQKYYEPGQIVPAPLRSKGAVDLGVYLLAKLTIKVHKQMREQMTIIMNGGEKG